MKRRGPRRGLIVTTVACLGLVLGCNGNRSLPILGEKVRNPHSGKLEDYRVPDFSLTDQQNHSVSSESLGATVQVVDFFFTSCASICPRMTANMKLVQEAFVSAPALRLLSFTIDPENDTVERLREYGEEHGIDPRRWSLLTGDEDVILELSKGFKVRAFEEMHGEERNLIHDGTFVLVDPQRRIRGYYDGRDHADVLRLIDDIRILL